MRTTQKVCSEGEMGGSFIKDVEPSADEVSRCVLLQRVDSTVIHEQLPSAHQQLLKVAMVVVSTTFPG
ncbi:hypothetical protein N9K47_00145 [bacterium]|nr:hypothetical protein [bacterium]